MKKYNQLKILVVLSCLLFLGCASTTKLRVPMEHRTPIYTEKAVIYVTTFKDKRAYSEVMKGVIDKGITEENVGEVVSKVLVDELRKHDINAVFIREAKLPMNQNDLLINGSVTDYLIEYRKIPPFMLMTLILGAKVKVGMEIVVLNSSEETLITREFKQEYISKHFKKATENFGPGSFNTIGLDIGLRKLCIEIINNEELKRIGLRP
jgi:hypothetical protein